MRFAGHRTSLVAPVYSVRAPDSILLFANHFAHNVILKL
jgi:hypothetical protein